MERSVGARIGSNLSDRPVSGPPGKKTVLPFNKGRIAPAPKSDLHPRKRTKPKVIHVKPIAEGNDMSISFPLHRTETHESLVYNQKEHERGVLFLLKNHEGKLDFESQFKERPFSPNVPSGPIPNRIQSPLCIPSQIPSPVTVSNTDMLSKIKLHTKKEKSSEWSRLLALLTSCFPSCRKRRKKTEQEPSEEKKLPERVRSAEIDVTPQVISSFLPESPVESMISNCCTGSLGRTQEEIKSLTVTKSLSVASTRPDVEGTSELSESVVCSSFGEDEDIEGLYLNSVQEKLSEKPSGEYTFTSTKKLMGDLPPLPAIQPKGSDAFQMDGEKIYFYSGTSTFKPPRRLAKLPGAKNSKVSPLKEVIHETPIKTQLIPSS